MCASRFSGVEAQLQLISDRPLDIDEDLSDVLDIVDPLAADWKQLGVRLCMPVSKLNVIAADKIDNARDCLLEMLVTWLNRNYDVVKHGQPTWRKLAGAVQPLNGAVFQKISEKHRAVTEQLHDNKVAKQLQNMSVAAAIITTPTSTPDTAAIATNSISTELVKLGDLSHPALGGRPSLKLLQLIKYKTPDGVTSTIRPKQSLAPKWRDMGTQFGFEQAKLDIWYTQYHNDEERANAVLSHWLNNGSADYPLSWVGLIEMCADIQLGTLADDIWIALINYHTQKR